jgi:excisionase family DNA binding protein
MHNQEEKAMTKEKTQVRVADKVSLSTEEAAKLCSVGLPSIYKAIKSGALKARWSGRRRVVMRPDLEKWLHSLPLVVGDK